MQTPSPDELEIRLAYLDDALSGLSDVVYAQTREIERLGERCRELESRVQALAEGSDGGDDGIPPHY